jgi:hypothetical protein
MDSAAKQVKEVKDFKKETRKLLGQIKEKWAELSVVLVVSNVESESEL